VVLNAVDEDKTTRIGEVVISYLNAPLNLDPQTKLVSFLVDPDMRTSDLLVEIDPDDETWEITERNNCFLLAAQ